MSPGNRTTVDLALPPPDEIAHAGAPVIEVEEVPRCEVCGSQRAHAVATGYDYELRTCANRWRYVECDECRQVRLHPRPATSTLDVIYPATYYSYHYDDLSALARKGKELMDRRKLAGIVARGGGRPSSYLDVGCGDGRYLDAMVRRGVPPDAVHGLELDERSVARAQARGLHVTQERVEDCDRFAPASLDLITMFHVVEHVSSPRAVVDRLATWLRPGAVLAVETPNVDSLDARLFSGGLWGGYHIPRHWHLFRPETMTRLLEAAGLEVLAVEHQTGHAFWMYSLHHRLRYADHPHPRLARRFDPLTSVAPLLAFTAFDRARATLGARTSAMLHVARRPA
jgi:2-polyprenyl-3-methyl-5-hydroxy-6-metoxy-1,4-benzoquinol methylase